MNHNFYRLSRKKLIFVFLVTFLISAIVSLLVVGFIQYARLQREKERASIMAEIIVSRLSHVIDNELAIPYTVKALLLEGNGIITDFENLMPEIVGSTPIRYVTLAPNGIISEIYPKAGNEKALGYDLIKDPEKILESSLEYETKELTLSGPYRLRLGGVGLVGCLPVYLDDPDGTPYFWGFTSVTISLPDGLTDSGLDTLEDQGYAYKLWRNSPNAHTDPIIMQSSHKLSSNPVIDVIELPNSSWSLGLTPKDGWGSKRILYFEFFISFLFCLLSSFLALNLVKLSMGRNRLEETLNHQSANYKMMNQLNEDLRIFRHDINNHMLTLSNLLKNGEIDSARDYIHFISGALSDSLSIVNTENYVFDALLAQKIEEARRHGIQVDKEVKIGRQLKIDNEDWSILLGNVLDNAIEACLIAKEENPQLRIIIQYHSGMLQAMITNTSIFQSSDLSSDAEPLPISTSKEDKKNHGFGMKQIYTVIKKYHGTIEIVRENGLFTLAFTLFEV